jgi:transposase
MRQKSGPVKESAEKVVKDVRRATRPHFSAEDKIRIVLEGLRGENSIAELCRREGSSRTSITAGRRTLAPGPGARPCEAARVLLSLKTRMLKEIAWKPR